MDKPFCACCGWAENLKKCGKCKKQLYCGAACSKRMWRFHSKVCVKDSDSIITDVKQPKWLRVENDVYNSLCSGLKYDGCIKDFDSLSEEQKEELYVTNLAELNSKSELELQAALIELRRKVISIPSFQATISSSLQEFMTIAPCLKIDAVDYTPFYYLAITQFGVRKVYNSGFDKMMEEIFLHACLQISARHYDNRTDEIDRSMKRMDKLMETLEDQKVEGWTEVKKFYDLIKWTHIAMHGVDNGLGTHKEVQQIHSNAIIAYYWVDLE